MRAEPAVYVVDDDLIVRILLEKVFQAANINVETYASAEDFLATYSPNNSGCLLLDIMMPGMSGLELQEALVSLRNNTPVIFLTGSDEVKVAVKALKAGAVDFIEKPVVPKTVLKCVNRAMELDLKNRYERLQSSQIEQRIISLTPREHEVMKWIIRGKSNKVIARILDISIRTVEVHRRNVIEKMQATSVVDLVQMVLRTQK